MTTPLIPLKNDDRTDNKWAHPIVKDTWTVGGLMTFVVQLTDPKLSDEEVREQRSRVEKMVLEMMSVANKMAEQAPGEWCEYWAPGLELEENAPQVRLKIRVPKRVDDKPLPVVFFIYGGSLVLGKPELYANTLVMYSEKLGAVVVSAEYREAPDNKYPAAVNDLHAAYKWMVENAGMLGIDPDRIVVYGESSGGHLGAALMHRLKRFNYINGIMPRAQVLVVPVMDDRQSLPSGKIVLQDNWDTDVHHKSWFAWLGHENYALGRIGPEAVPGRAEGDDFKSLPPAYLHAMESDPDRDDVIRYASGLLAVGTFCELHQWGGTNHTSLVIKPTELSGRFTSLLLAEMQDAITYDLRRPWVTES